MFFRVLYAAPENAYHILTVLYHKLRMCKVDNRKNNKNLIIWKYAGIFIEMKKQLDF